MVSDNDKKIIKIYENICISLSGYSEKSTAFFGDDVLTLKKKQLSRNLVYKLKEPPSLGQFCLSIREAQNLISGAICHNIFLVQEAASGFFGKRPTIGRLGDILLEAKKSLFLQEWKYSDTEEPLEGRDKESATGHQIPSIINDPSYQKIQLLCLNFLFEELYKIKAKSEEEKHNFYEAMVVVETILCVRYVEQMYYLAIQFCAELKEKTAISELCSKFVLFFSKENENLRKFLKFSHPLDNHAMMTYNAQKNVLKLLSVSWNEEEFLRDINRQYFIVGNEIIRISIEESQSPYKRDLLDATDRKLKDPSYSILTTEQRELLFWQVGFQSFLIYFLPTLLMYCNFAVGEQPEKWYKNKKNVLEVGPWHPRMLITHLTHEGKGVPFQS